MTESEILQNALQGAQVALGIFSVFLSIVSAYIVALYLVLRTAPATLKLLAFGILSIALLTLCAMAYNLQYLGEGMHTAWKALPAKSSQMPTLGPPLIVRSLFLDGSVATTWIAWSLGTLVYIALAY